MDLSAALYRSSGRTTLGGIRSGPLAATNERMAIRTVALSFARLFSIVIILVYSNAALAVTRKRGYFYDMQSRFSKRLTNFAIVYAGSMVLRYFLYMYLVPEARWLHGTIPIVFHLVLATFLLAYADISTKETNHTPIIVDDELAVREEVLSQ